MGTNKRRPKHLILPDSHAHPDHNNDRFEALSNFIEAERPDVIVNIGDFADMPSLSSFDRGHLSYEKRRYQRDIDVVIDAQERLFKRFRRHSNYRPRLVVTLGNHEDRISREVQSHPELEGKLSCDDLRYRKYGWEVVPFLKSIQIDGISYCHYFVSGVMGRPIGGESIGRTLCNKLHTSAVQGHSHLFDHSERTAATGNKLFGMSVGCFTHPDYVEDWNRATVSMWWKGVVVLEDLDRNGYYDQIKTVTLRKLMRDFY